MAKLFCTVLLEPSSVLNLPKIDFSMYKKTCWSGNVLKNGLHTVLLQLDAYTGLGFQSKFSQVAFLPKLCEYDQENFIPDQVHPKSDLSCETLCSH